MEELKRLLAESLDQNLDRIILSNSRDASRGTKSVIRPILVKQELCFQRTLYKGTQVFHQNMTAGECAEEIAEQMQSLFKQAEIKHRFWEGTVLCSNKGKMTVKKRKVQNGKNAGNGSETASSKRGENESASRNAGTEAFGPTAHNRTKNYILQEGIPVDFLVGLGVQTPDGKVVKSRYDKFRQINRYLEFIEDVVKKLPTDRPIRIIDFGCGKSYLTFAMYYYLHELCKREVRVTGLDLKEDVIDLCNKLAEQYHYDDLSFEKGDISAYEGADAVDMVVTLHACDVATDYAIEKAVKWGARVIMVVPCCQHEVNKQISNEELRPILKYGIIKERISALVTDAVRANLLEEIGYDTRILEFIDMEHTPKNLLIRAVKRDGMRPHTGKKIEEITEFLNINTTLQKLLKED